MKKYLVILLTIILSSVHAQITNPWSDFKINTTSYGFQTKPEVVLLDNGKLFICWQSDDSLTDYTGERNQNIFGQIFDPDGIKRGREFKINTTSYAVYLRDIALTTLKKKGVIIAWTINEYPEVHAVILDTSGNVIKSEFVVQKTGYYFCQPSIQSINDERFIILYQKDIPGLLYGKIYNADGIILKDEIPFQINTVTSLTSAKSDSSTFRLLWTQIDSSFAYTGMFTQKIDSNGKPISKMTKILSSEEYPEDPMLLKIETGYLLTWINISVKLQQYDDNFEATSSIIQVSDNSLPYPDLNNFPKIVQFQNGNILVVWEGLEIKAQLFNKALQKIGPNFILNKLKTNFEEDVSLSNFNENCCFIVWAQYTPSDVRDIYGKIMPENPVYRKLNPFHLISPIDNELISIMKPTLKWSSAINSLLSYPWEVLYDLEISRDFHFESSEIHSNLFDTTYTFINLDKNTTYYWRVHARNAYSDSILNGEQVGMFTTSADATGTKTEKINSSRTQISNYPNPFNSATIIKIVVPQEHVTSLRIYDVRGRLVKTISIENNSIAHTFKWEGDNDHGEKLSSGIYIAILNTEKYVYTNKLLLLK